MNKPKQRQPHADYIIEQANDMSLRFDVKVNGEWKLVTNNPCVFYELSEYRLHEREFPKTSLSDSVLEDIANEAVMKDIDDTYIYRQIANAAIRQYILDTEDSK